MPTHLDLTAMAMLGILGTGHCIGMCGPLILAVPARSGRLAPQLLYHLGRLLTYGLLGGIAGSLGSGLNQVAQNVGGGSKNPLINVVTLQSSLSIVAALFLAFFALVRLGLVAEPRWMVAVSPHHFPGFGAVSKGSAKQQFLALFLWGMMLGTIPCGLSYAAVARALAAGSPTKGAVLVLFFGLGTLPGLLFIGTASARLFVRHRRLTELVSGALMAAMALSLFAESLRF